MTAYCVALVVLLVSRSLQPTPVADVVSQRDQVRSLALEGRLLAQAGGAGRAPQAFRRASADMLVRQSAALSHRLAAQDVAPKARKRAAAVLRIARQVTVELSGLQAAHLTRSDATGLKRRLGKLATEARRL